jgi:hypothetical protein
MEILIKKGSFIAYKEGSKRGERKSERDKGKKILKYNLG